METKHGRHSSAIHEGERCRARRIVRWRLGIHRRGRCARSRRSALQARARTTETRNTCPYCSVACGMIMYSQGDSRRTPRPRSSISRATPTIRPIAARSARRARRCSTSSTAPNRLQVPDAPQAGHRTSSSAITWDDALDRIARLMKDDRDANFIAKNDDGVTVNRWTDAPASSPRPRPRNETALPDLQGRARRSGCWHSTTRRGFDTARRCPVWARHSAVAR